MRRLDCYAASLFRLVLILGVLDVGSQPSFAQSRKSSRKSSEATPRVKEADKNTPVADRMVLRDGKELLGQVLNAGVGGTMTILARRDWVRTHLADRVKALEAGRSGRRRTSKASTTDEIAILEERPSSRPDSERQGYLLARS